ncbi:MAG: Uma2 family endonuclease [Saprospiraceae bacterium]|nr:Uma2 family endonuclease [Saprospiraceae bacterium]
MQPNHFVVCDPNKIQERGCFGAPDWVIEILSHHNKKKDLNVKYEVYEEAGVMEYLIVMPREKIVETFQLVNKKHQRMGAYAEDDTISPLQWPELKCDLSLSQLYL